MSNELERRIRNVRSAERRIRPDAAWVRATRATLVMQVKNNLPTTRMGFFAQQQMLWRTLWTSKVSQLVRKPFLASLSFVALAMGGSILSVSAAEHSLPGDFFYGLKLVTEQARLALTPATEDKLKLKTEFTERRVNEFTQIASNDPRPDQVVQAAAVMKSDLNTLKQQLAQVNNEVPPAKAAAAAKLVDQKTNEVISALQATKSQLRPESKAQVTDVQSVAADTGVAAITVLAQQHQASDDVVPASDIAQVIQDHAKAVTGATAASLIVTDASSTAATSTTFLDVTSSTADITSSTLPVIVSQVKDLTTQAFAVQKAQDQLEATASALSAASSSSTDDGLTGGASSTVSASSTLDGAATGSNMGASSTTSGGDTSASSSSP